jgi:hypothetical protein
MKREIGFVKSAGQDIHGNYGLCVKLKGSNEIMLVQLTKKEWDEIKKQIGLINGCKVLEDKKGRLYLLS